MTVTSSRLLEFLPAINRGSLNRPDAAMLLRGILESPRESAEAAQVLQAMSLRGVAPREVIGFRQVLMEDTTPIAWPDGAIVDNCGTGGDGANLFAVSTCTMFVLAGAGVKVAKSGNRTFLSQSGSANVLEKLGVNLNLPTNLLGACLEETGVCFVPATTICPKLEQLAQVRRLLSGPSIFNLLGPLLNVSGMIKVVGVWSPQAQACMAGCLERLQTKQACVIHSDDGLDEISLEADSHVWQQAQEGWRKSVWTAESFGLPRYPKETFQVESLDESADIVRAILEYQDLPHRDLVIANAAAVLFHIGRASSLLEGVALARDSLQGRRAFCALHKLIGFTKA